MRKIALVLSWLQLLCPAVAHAESRPSWSLRTPAADHSYHYYIGRSSQSNSEAEAFTAARQNAVAELILENFGFDTKIDSEATSSASESIIVNRLGEKSQVVQIKDFEQIDSYVEQRGGPLLDVWILYRYKNSSLEHEKLRLVGERSPSSSETTESGNLTLKFSTSFEITSLPEGAEVFIDGERWGLTPLKINGSLSPAKHEIIIDHPDFVVENDSINLAMMQNMSVRKILKPAFGYISFRSKLAATRLNGKNNLDLELPTQEIKLAANQEVEFRFSNRQAESISRVFRVARDQHLDLEIELPLKPAHFKWAGLDRSLEVSVDNQMVHKTGDLMPTRFHVSAGESHLVCAVREAYVPICHHEFFRGDETIVFSKPEFVKVEKIEPKKLSQLNTVHENLDILLDSQQTPYLIDFFLGFGGATLASRNDSGFTELGIAFKSAFFGPLGYEFGAAFGSNDNGQSSGSSSGASGSAPVYIMTSYDLYVGMPLFIPLTRRTRILLTAEEGYVASSFAPSKTGMQTSTYSQSRFGYGAGLVFAPVNKGFGGDIKFLYNSYSSAQNLMGRQSGMIQVGLIYGFN